MYSNFSSHQIGTKNNYLLVGQIVQVIQKHFFKSKVALFWLTVLTCLGWLIEAYLSRISPPGWSAPAVRSGLSYTGCPAQLSCPGCLVLVVIVEAGRTNMSRLQGCHILAVLPSFPVILSHPVLFLAYRSSLSCPGWPVEMDLSQLSCPGFPILVVFFGKRRREREKGNGEEEWKESKKREKRRGARAFLSRLSRLGCPAMVVISQLPCPCCHVLAVLPCRPALSFLFWLSGPDRSLLLCCPGCSVLVVLYPCRVLAVTFWPSSFLSGLFRWSCSSCSVLSVPSRPSYSCCLVLAILGCPYVAVLGVR